MKIVRLLSVTGILLAGTLAMACSLITAAQADTTAQGAVGGGTVNSTQFDRAKNGGAYYDVNITNATGNFEVYVNACSGAVIKVVQNH